MLWPAQASGVFVNPALTEPYGLTLIEAAAHGLPVVATRNGGPNDIVEELENGILVDPTDTNAIGETVADLLGDARNEKQLRETAGQRAR